MGTKPTLEGEGGERPNSFYRLCDYYDCAHFMCSVLVGNLSFYATSREHFQQIHLMQNWMHLAASQKR